MPNTSLNCLVNFDKILIFYLVKEIVVYTCVSLVGWLVGINSAEVDALLEE